MDSGSLLSFWPDIERVITNNGTVGVRIIIIEESNFLEFRRGGQSNKLFYRDKITDYY